MLKLLDFYQSLNTSLESLFRELLNASINLKLDNLNTNYGLSKIATKIWGKTQDYHCYATVKLYKICCKYDQHCNHDYTDTHIRNTNTGIRNPKEPKYSRAALPEQSSMSAIKSVMILYMYLRPRNGPQLLLGRKLWEGAGL